MKAFVFLSVILLGIPSFEREATAGGFFSRGPIRRFLFFGGPIRRRLFARRLARRFCRRCLPPRFARPPRCGGGLHGGGCNGRNFRPFVGDIIDPTQNGSGITGGLSPVSRFVPDESSEFERVFNEAEQPERQAIIGKPWRGLCETSSGQRQSVGPIEFPENFEGSLQEGSLVRRTPNKTFFFRMDEETGKLAVKINSQGGPRDTVFCVVE